MKKEKKHTFTKIKYYLTVICMLTVALNIKAQDSTATVADPDSVDMSKDLPDLSVFLNSAMENSPLLKMSDKQISQVLEQIKIQKKSWADYFIIDANSKYGLYNQVTITDQTGTTTEDPYGIKSNKEQFNYYFGLTLRLPISKITSRQNELKVLTENLEEKKLQREDLKNQIQQLIVDQYYNLNYLYKSMKINQDMLQAFTVSLLKKERDLSAGTTDLEDYNAVLVQKGKVEDSFVKSQNEFYAQYKKLILISGLKSNTNGAK